MCGVHVGASSVNIEVAGVCAQVEASSSSFLEPIRRRYGSFISGKKPTLRLEVNLNGPPTGWGRGSTHSQTEVFKPEYTATEDEKYLVLEGEEFKTVFDKSKALAETTQPPVLYPFDLTLRALLALKLLDAKGFFVHASAVLKEDKVYLFFGPSGSGKTTVADLAREETLSDDLIAIKKVKETFWAFGTPFWQGLNKGAPLRCLFSLQKASRVSLVQMKPAEALRELMESVECLIGISDYRQSLFEAVGSLVEEVPCFRLSFCLDKPFWPALEEAGLLGK